jgi:hypothetical protein
MKKQNKDYPILFPIGIPFKNIKKVKRFLESNDVIENNIVYKIKNMKFKDINIIFINNNLVRFDLDGC